MANFFLVCTLIAVNAIAAPPVSPKLEEMKTEVREKLSPVAEAVLEKHCGSDCPSFQLEPVFTPPGAESLDNIGFSSPPVVPESAQLQSVAVRVVIQSYVPAAQRSSLKAILTTRLSNEVSVPVTVRWKNLQAPSPLAAKPQPPPVEKPQPSLARALIWPGCLLSLALIGLFALIFYLKHKRALLASAKESTTTALPTEGVGPERDFDLTPERLAALLKSRSADLQWWIEERAAAKDTSSLLRIVSVFPAERLSAELRFSGPALQAIADLREKPREKSPSREAVAWVEESIERAHWSRIEEERHPLKRLQRIADAQIMDIYFSLPQGLCQAALVSAIPQPRWPALLGHLTSEQRIGLGIQIDAYQKGGAFERDQADKLTVEAMEKISRSWKGHLRVEGLVEDFSLFLSEKEGRALWQTIGAGGNTRAAMSAEHLFEKLDPAALTEVCLHMDIQSLRTLVGQAPEATRRRVLASLPKALQERVIVDRARARSAGNHADEDANLLRARADLMGAYRRFIGEERSIQ